MKPSAFASLALLFVIATVAHAQTHDSRAFSRRNTFTVFTEYSNDSSHMLMGISEDRKLTALGASYARRLWSSRVGDLRYLAEVRPVLMESDPVNLVTTVYSFIQSYSYTSTITCGRRWTFAQGFSPIGLQYSLRPGHRLQPFVSSTAGYILSTRPIPTANAGSFNFTFDFGAGVELFHSETRSIQLEYRFHHISNHGTADVNPGIDNGVFKLSYAFGR